MEVNHLNKERDQSQISAFLFWPEKLSKTLFDLPPFPSIVIPVTKSDFVISAVIFGFLR